MILAVIPARSGSKGIPNKNTYNLCGKPLIEWTIRAVTFMVPTVITSDCPKIKELFGPIIDRPPELCNDDTPMVPVIQHAVNYFEQLSGEHVDMVVTLQPTSPLRTGQDILKAIDLITMFEKDSLYSGYHIGIKTKDKVYDKHKQAPHFQRNGAIFITKRNLLDQGKLWDENAIEFVMPKSRSIDIDDIDDMLMAEALLKHRMEELK